MRKPWKSHDLCSAVCLLRVPTSERRPHRSVRIGADGLATRLAAQGGIARPGDAVLEEADRAVAEKEIHAAGVLTLETGKCITEAATDIEARPR